METSQGFRLESVLKLKRQQRKNAEAVFYEKFLQYCRAKECCLEARVRQENWNATLTRALESACEGERLAMLATMADTAGLELEKAMARLRILEEGVGRARKSLHKAFMEEKAMKRVQEKKRAAGYARIEKNILGEAQELAVFRQSLHLSR